MSGAIELPESHADVKWYRAMKAATVTVDGHVMLDGASWPDMASPLLFVRNFYAPCWESVMAKGESKDLSRQRKFVVMGTPGIGKSAFGLYILWRALAEGKTVIYKTRKRDAKAFLFRDDKVFTVPQIAYIPEISEPSTILIVDGLEPPSENAFTLLITSPLRERWKEFVKTEGVQELVFPVFSFDEMLKLRATAFGSKDSCDESSVVMRYAKWGGSVRHVLSHPEDEWQDELTTNAANMTFAQLTASVDALAKERASEAKHNVVHLKTRSELEDTLLQPDAAAFYRFSHGELASLYVQELVYMQLRERETDKLFAFLRASGGTPALAALRGVQYEQFALGALAKGGTFEVKLLRRQGGDPGLSGSLTACGAHLELPESSMRPFSSLADVQLGEAAVWRPRSKTFCTIDAVVCTAHLVLAANATVSVSHPLHLTNARGGLDFIASELRLPEGGEIAFLWLAPDDIFDQMSAPSPLKVDGRVLAPAALSSHIVGKRVVQYAVRVSVPTGLLPTKH